MTTKTMTSHPIRFSFLELQTCSGCNAWVEAMHGQSFTSLQRAIEEARRLWWQQIPVTGWLEAIEAHPRLGDGQAVQSKQHASTTEFQREAANEQDHILAASQDVSAQMQAWNKKYEDKFGHLFLLFANGRSPVQVLQCIQERINNTPIAELKEAAQQEINIIEDRLTKCVRAHTGAQAQSRAEQRTGVLTCSPCFVNDLLDVVDDQLEQHARHWSLFDPVIQRHWHFVGLLPARARELRSAGKLLRHLDPGAHGVDLLHADASPRQQVTCHVLDTTRGCPARSLPVTLLRSEDGSRPEDGLWRTINTVKTNSDGRAQGLSQGLNLAPGMYRVAFDTAQYYSSAGLNYAFYPQPVIDFTVTQQTVDEHFHIPLLISPFSYCTYRGS